MKSWPRSVDSARLLVLLLLAVCVRLLYVHSISPDAPIASVDAWGYHRLALNLDLGNGFSLRREAPFVPDAVRTPLYPAFLWLSRRLLGPAPRAAVLVQVAIDGCTTALTWWLAARLAGPRAGFIAALLYALNPTQVRYTGELMTETLFSFLLALSTGLLVHYILTSQKTPLQEPARAAIESDPKPQGCTAAFPQVRMFRHSRRPGRWPWRGVRACVQAITAVCRPPRAKLAIAALLSGLAILCKPNAQFLPLIWLAVLAVLHWRNWPHALADAILTLAMVTIVLLPWIVRNQLVFGRPFLSTAFEGNVSRVSAPATLAAARGQYASPWSDEWETLFHEVVTTTAERYGWHKPWASLTARELDTHDHQVYLVAREILRRHPVAWLASHAQGVARYLEPQTYRVLYARFSGRGWPPDVLDDAVIHAIRAIARGRWAEAGQIIASERWYRLDTTQRAIWWGTFAGQVITLGLMLRGAWKLRRRPALLLALLLTTAYVLWVPGPIAYERFRAPATSLILALVSASTQSCARKSPML